MLNLNKKYDEIFLKNRGFVTRLPRNKRCIVITSGGMDSNILILKLLEEEFEVFPIFIRRGQRNLKYEERSVDYFSSFFKRKYKKFHAISKVSIDIPPNNFKKCLKNYSNKLGYPMRDPIMHNIAVQFAIFLENKTNKKIRMIFSGTNMGDPFPHCSLVGIRASNISICENMKDWSWQITSPFIDNYIGDEWTKKDIILYASRKNFPIEKTRSCYKNHDVHCGKCLSCLRRKKAFKEANLKDPTIYLN